MKAIGLYREMGSGSKDVESIFSMVDFLSFDQRRFIVEYLSGGVEVFDVMGASLDPINGEVCVAGGPSLVSDGEWVWRSDLKYFVDKYGIKLPGEFIEYVKYNKNIDVRRSNEIMLAWEVIIETFEKSGGGYR